MTAPWVRVVLIVWNTVTEADFNDVKMKMQCAPAALSEAIGMSKPVNVRLLADRIFKKIQLSCETSAPWGPTQSLTLTVGVKLNHIHCLPSVGLHKPLLPQ